MLMLMNPIQSSLTYDHNVTRRIYARYDSNTGVDEYKGRKTLLKDPLFGS